MYVYKLTHEISNIINAIYYKLTSIEIAQILYIYVTSELIKKYSYYKY